MDGSGYEGPDPTTAPTVGTSNTMDAERGHLYFAADGDISTLGQQGLQKTPCKFRHGRIGAARTPNKTGGISAAVKPRAYAPPGSSSASVRSSQATL